MLAGGFAREFLGELDALGFAAGEGGGLLADVDVAEADLFERVELVAHHRHGGEEIDAFFDGHVEHIGDGLALEGDIERFAVVALAVADVAGDVDIGQEVHLDLDDAIALAGFAAAALDVEREAAGLVAARLGFRQAGEPVADRREGAGVGGGVGARGAADRRLVDVDDLVDEFEALDAVMLGRMLARAHDAARGGGEQGFDEEGGLAAAGNAGDGGEAAERDFGGDVFQIVAARADDLDALGFMDRCGGLRGRAQPIRR